MTGAGAGAAPPGRDAAERAHRAAVSVTRDGVFAGSGFLAAGGVVVTAAHVVAGGRRIAVGTGGIGGPDGRVYPVEAARLSPESDGGLEFFPYPDLAVLTVPGLEGHPPVELAADEAAPGTLVAALGYSQWTPANGIAADSLALRVEGWSGGYLRVSGDTVREGHSGSPLVDPAGRVVGMIKGSRDFAGPSGGWCATVGALHRMLGTDRAAAPAPPGPPPRDAEIVDALEGFPALVRLDGRFDLLFRMGEHLGLRTVFPADERADRRSHLFAVLRSCHSFRDRRVGFIALYTAMEEAAPYDAALERLRELIGRAIGGWEEG